MTGFPGRPTLENIQAVRLNSDLEKDGEFECSDSLVNKIARAIEWTFLSNVFSVQLDCPGREKLGYGGDIAATTNAFCYLFNMHNFYSKTAYDYRDVARPSGAMTETAPYMEVLGTVPALLAGNYDSAQRSKNYMIIMEIHESSPTTMRSSKNRWNFFVLMQKKIRFHNV